MFKFIIILIVVNLLFHAFIGKSWIKATILFVTIFAGIFWGYLMLIGNGEHATSSAVGDAALFTFCVALVFFTIFGICSFFIWLGQAANERHGNMVMADRASDKAAYLKQRTTTHLRPGVSRD